MEQIKAWWAQAPARDQMSVIIGGTFVLLYILFMLVLKPVYGMRAQEEVKVNSLKGSLENVRNLAAQVVEQNQSATSERSSPLERIVQQSVSSNNLRVSSMNAAGRDGLRLRFDEAPFEDVLKWLYEMEVTNNLQIKDLSVAATSNSGRVSVNLRLYQE